MNIQTLLSKVYQQPRRRSLQVKARLPWALAFAGIVAVVCTIELIARGAFAVDGPKRMEEIKANRFVVVDESGKTTAEFGVLSDGRPGLAVWDNKTNLVAVLSIDDGGPRFSFQNKTGVSLLSIGLVDGNLPVMVFNGTDGGRRLGMVVTENGTVALQLNDLRKQKRCELSVDREGQPKIVLRDRDGNARAGLIVHDKGGSGLDLLDAAGRTRAVMQVNNEGEPDAALLGPNGEALWSARNQSGAPQPAAQDGASKSP
jgi:hypothetical protein